MWSKLDTQWACLDCELMPWSAKAQELLRPQYAPVGSAGLAALPRAVAALNQAAARLEGTEKDTVLAIKMPTIGREHDVGLFVAAYRRYCWRVDSLVDLKLAPFHLLATEGRVHSDKNHLWHMEMLAGLAKLTQSYCGRPRSLAVDLTDPTSEAAGIAWWEELTARGGEGMVVKPLSFIHRSAGGSRSPP